MRQISPDEATHSVIFYRAKSRIEVKKSCLVVESTAEAAYRYIGFSRLVAIEELKLTPFVYIS